MFGSEVGEIALVGAGQAQRDRQSARWRWRKGGVLAGGGVGIDRWIAVTGASTSLAGAIIVVGGYNLVMLTLTGIAVLALLLLVFVVPETAVSETTAVHDGAATFT
ncbi:MAG: hypothetical protein DLM60_05495 [Pseudonocardiales bacterium]|nr:hypothetical protein [Actinomycetota bacterium]PZS21777.1 MAG: hypothetical protein DLM60_05495 [Pseudonocardiales bacterium]